MWCKTIEKVINKRKHNLLSEPEVQKEVQMELRKEEGEITIYQALLFQ